MIGPLVLVIVSLIFGFVMHVAVWRSISPKRYLVWLPILFALSSIIAATTMGTWSPAATGRLSTGQLLAALMLYSVMVACYTGGYAGVVEYSPSAEILRAVAAEPNGIRPEDLRVSTLSEDALTGKRFRHLLRNGLIVVDDSNHFVLTPFGRLVVKACLLYRWLFGLRESAAG